MTTVSRVLLFLSLIPLTLSLSTPTDRVIVDLSTSPKHFVHYWKHAFGSGHATLTLRSDWRNSLVQAVQDLGLQGVRHHGIFDDDMNVVIAPRTYNFTLIEESWRFQVKNNVVPIVELSFMPAILANCTWTSPKDGRIVNPGHLPCNDTVMQYVGITVPPTNYDDWYDLVKHLVEHAVRVFGTNEVLKWSFEVWNELWGMDFPSPYMSLYNASASAIKNINKHFKIGGPATARLQYAVEFVQEANKMKVPFDFISTHMYPTDPQCGVGNEWNPDCLPNHVSTLKKRLLQLTNKELYLTEYNVGCCLGYQQHDGPGAAAFIFRAIESLDGITDILSWWTFTDIFEEGESIDDHTEYQNVYGLMTISGIPKPSWRAFQLLHQFAGNKRLPLQIIETNDNGREEQQQQSTCTERENTNMYGFNVDSLSVQNISGCCNACQQNEHCNFWSWFHLNTTCMLKSSDAGRTFEKGITSGSSIAPPPVESNGTRISAFATNRIKDGDSLDGVAVFLSYWSNTGLESNRSVSVSFKGMATSFLSSKTATEYRIDINHANAIRSWRDMGSPQKPTTNQIEKLISASKVIPATIKLNDDFSTTVTMNPNSAVVIIY
jgi:xylan 1,4-beta-xylosidase